MPFPGYQRFAGGQTLAHRVLGVSGVRVEGFRI